MRRCTESTQGRLLRKFTILWIPAICLLLACASAAANETAYQIVRVEEDWEMVVGEPDLDRNAPQVICVISPVGDVDSLHGAFEVNVQTLPEFQAGGMQLQVWSGENSLATRKSPNESWLAHTGETVRWTQSMKLQDGSLTFEITDGQSTTWGDFGGEGYLKAARNTSLTSLNHYDPAISIANSGVSYAGNRVASLVLKRVRLTLSNGAQYVDHTSRVVHMSD